MRSEPTRSRSGQALLLDAALETIPFGFCVWSPELTLVLWNQHYLDIYGFPKAKIRRGMTLRDVVELSCALGNHPETSATNFYEDYAAELKGNCAGARCVNLETTAAGRRLETAHVYAPGLGWVVTHEDVTEKIERSDLLMEGKRALARQYALVDAAINNISQGLSMFDGEFRLVTSNRKYQEMYALPDELVRPGTRFEDILSHRCTAGLHAPSDPEAYIHERKAIVKGGKFVREVIKMTDGTYLSLRHQPLAGGGVVTTHEDITEQLQAEARMRHMATHDALTDLPNRALFREELEKALAGGHAVFALLLVNLDHFKAVNDDDGHAVGDMVLRKVARRLGRTVVEEGLVARLGGDEFAVLLRGVAPRVAAGVASRIVKALGEPFRLGQRELGLSASVGIAIAPGDGASADALMNNADLALLKAKSEGRATYHFFEGGMDANLQRRRLLEKGLRGAQAGGELAVVFQPMISARTGRIVGAEALLRWTHAELGPVSPSEFIPVAEDTGLIVPIGEWVLHSACREAAGWPEGISIAVNLSAVQFRRPWLVEQVRGALAATGLAPGRLELEITESLLLEESEATLSTLHALRALGARVAMDDFGTGYSALSYLRSFPFDKIKIDRSFMTDLTTKADSRAILKAMIGLGKSLGMVTVAEGIETQEQLEAVRGEGCTQVQGFLFSPPVPGSTFRALLAAQPKKGAKPVS